MVHVRINEREANPNPHINFITPLNMMDTETQEQSKQLLRALAAQVRPIMKAQGFVVNSFEEYEHNRVFFGRNWNNGECVEIVLRGAGGGFLPTSLLLSTLCHELAHIKHMNHGPAFQALWAKLRNDVKELQRKGYYGDGFWSSGTRLADFTRMGSRLLDAEDLPEFMCGGAQSRTPPASSKRRRRRRTEAPSNKTGAQTAKRRKAGSRVTAQGLFKGSGCALNADVSDEEQKKTGAGFRRKAGSKRAREERALAAERRLLALQGRADPGTQAATKDVPEPGPDSDSSDYECAPETDQDRRRTMLESTDQSELDGLKTWKRDYSDDFIFPLVASDSESRPSSHPVCKNLPSPSSGLSHTDKRGGDLGAIELSSDDEHEVSLRPSCDVQSLPMGGTAASSDAAPSRKEKQKELSVQSRADRTNPHGTASHQNIAGRGAASSTKKQQTLPYGSLLQDEIASRKKESLGMDGPGRRLGERSNKVRPGPAALNDFWTTHMPPPKHRRTSTTSTAGGSWSCAVCTLINDPEHLACSACATPRGEAVWAHNLD